MIVKIASSTAPHKPQAVVAQMQNRQSERNWRAQLLDVSCSFLWGLSLSTAELSEDNWEDDSVVESDTVYTLTERFFFKARVAPIYSTLVQKMAKF